jgi:hypothetical protein
MSFMPPALLLNCVVRGQIVIRPKSPIDLSRSTLRCFISLVLLTFVGSGCSNSPTPSAQPNDSKGGEPADPKGSGDESLTSEEYLRLGMPAQDRDWFGGDMVNAEKILASLAQQGYRQLPRYKSERSGEMFARLTSPQNLDLFKNRTLPLDARFPQALNYFQASNQVFKLYLAGFLKKEVRDSELVELMGAQFRSTVVMLELVDEFLPTIQKDDPKYQVRMQGFDQMKRGLASVVAGGLQTLTERESYRGSELVRLVGYMQETFPLIVPRLPPGARTETLLRLAKMQDDPALKDLQPGLGELHSKVKASVEKAAGP